jgi:hypothetical protein
MGQFKVGDRVRVCGPLRPPEKGLIGTVVEVGPDLGGNEKLDRYSVEFEDHTNWFWSTELEMVNDSSSRLDESVA